MPPRLTALRCLFVVALHRGVQLAPELLGQIGEADPAADMVKIARRGGLKAKVLTGRRPADIAGLSYAYPLLARRTDGFWVMVVNRADGPDGPVLAIVDPRTEAEGLKPVKLEEFAADWSGVLVLLKKPATLLVDEPREFGLSWFVPEVMRHRRFLRDVALAAIFSTVIAFAMPLMFQILIDKVVGHHAYTTLAALVLIFGLLIVFDTVFSYTRQYLMLSITAKIDARLAARTFEQLMRLPLSFFEQSTAGVILRHLSQTDTIRHFLTGRLFQTFLDALALPVLLVVLALYSGILTLVVLGFSLAIAAIIGVMIPTFRAQLEKLYAAEGARQSHLVETIHGMRTVKSLALEPQRMQGWDERVASGIRQRATVGKLAIIAGVSTQFLEKSMQIAILAVGAFMVFEGQLSIGALVAFNMIAGRVTGPLVQIVALFNEYQETALAVKMLGIVMKHAPERDPGRAALKPPLNGRIAFEGVNFRYPNAATPALDNVSFAIEPGQVVGIVGRSGSGKTTITRLIQGIHTAQGGVVRLDEHDVRTLDLSHLRRSVGVVLQENFLFRGTIAQNIAAARPDASLPEIMTAAKQAGAEEFITRLSNGYDTLVEENGANLSGGQRQRLAIARALLLNPRLLIFDEATSALDPDSEAIIQDQLSTIARGRTLVIVSHRLTSLTAADNILVLEQGKLVDAAPHATLLDRCDVYRHLWQRQNRGVSA